MSYQAKIYRKQGGNELVVASGGVITVESGGSIAVNSGGLIVNAASGVQNIRTRFTVAAVNAGATLLAAIAGYKYRMIHCIAISIGGAAGAVTTVDVIGTLSSARKLVAYAQASLTQSTVLVSGATGAAVLADGASFTQNDANTAITVGITGSSITVATHIDFIFSYTVEA
jgi:hypothetical protein